MNAIQNIDVSLQEIVKNISKNSYLIPKFQRDFVWNNKDIVDLGDSIIRGYPISSLLIMAENGSLKVGSHSLVKEHSNYRDSNNPEDEVKYYVLDGQQRLTSISKLFLNLDSKNEYYFDLLSILIAEFPNDYIENDAGVKGVFSKSKTSDIFCRSFPISKDNSEKPTRQNNRFISGRSIIENRFGSVINKFLREFRNANEEDIDKYTDYLSAVFGSLGGYSIPATVISRDSELGIVIRVFEKVNSTGKKLTLFDLINAKSFQTNNPNYSLGLADYLTFDIQSKISQNNLSSKSVERFLNYNQNSSSFENLGKIVRIFEVADLLKKGQRPAIFKSTMLEKNPEFWFDSWNENSDLFLDIIQWVHKEGLNDIGQTSYIEYIVAVLLANPKSFTIKSFTNQIKKYAFYLTLSSTPFNKSNLDTVEHIFDISKKAVKNLPTSDLSYSLNLTDENILQIMPSSSRFSTIINAFYIDKIRGLFTCDITGTSIKSHDFEDMEKHHFYPKSKVTNFTTKSEFNSIANYVVISHFDNREVFKDQLPKAYLTELQARIGDTIRFACQQNLIDLDHAISISNEQEGKDFLRLRAQKIAEVLNKEFTTKQADTLI